MNFSLYLGFHPGVECSSLKSPLEKNGGIYLSLLLKSNVYKCWARMNVQKPEEMLKALGGLILSVSRLVPRTTGEVEDLVRDVPRRDVDSCGIKVKVRTIGRSAEDT